MRAAGEREGIRQSNPGAPSFTAHPGWGCWALLGTWEARGKSEEARLSSDAPGWWCVHVETKAWRPVGLTSVISLQTRVLRVGTRYSDSFTSFMSFISFSRILVFSLTERSKALATGQADNLPYREFDLLLIISIRGGSAICVNQGGLGAEIKPW